MPWFAAAPLVIATVAGTAMQIAGAATKNQGLQIGGSALSSLASLGAGAFGAAGNAAGSAAGAASSAGGGAASGLFSALSLGGQLATGILGKTQAAADSNAQADMYERQAKLAEQRQIQRDQAILAKEHANAAASGLSASSGSPLAVTLDSARGLEMNAADARRSGELQAYSRRLQAQGYTNQIPGFIANDLLKLAPSVLSLFMSR